MPPVRRLTVAEQTAAHLREGLRGGRWKGTLPGVIRLARELNVCRDTVEAALRQLESEGLLGARGRGRSRTITQHGAARHSLRVGILLFDAPLQEQPRLSQLLFQLQQELETAGNVAFFAGKTQVQLDFDLRRITRQIAKERADAWIVAAGTRELLGWFAGRTVPCLALFGRTEGLAIARTGPEMPPAFRAATRRLLQLGHRRIVLLTRQPRRKPVPGNVEQAFLDELAAHGIQTGPYNLPDWEETPEGYWTLLENLFRVTPPTALIIDETPRVIAAMQFLLHYRMQVPEQVSLVSTDYDSSFVWCRPPIAHVRWDSEPVVRRVVRWVEAVKRGRVDRRTINVPAEFVPGGSIGPAPRVERVSVPTPRAETSRPGTPG